MKFKDIRYERIPMEKFETEFKAVLNEMENADTFGKFDAAFINIYKKRDSFDTMFQLANIRYCTNTRNETYLKEVGHLDEIMPRFEDLVNQFYIVLNQSKFKGEISKKWGKHILDIAKFSVNGFDPIILNELKEHNKLCTEYSKLKDKAEIDFNGEKLNLGSIGKYLLDNDRKVREKASRAQWKFFADHQEEFDDLFDRMVKVRHKMALKMGHENFVALGYQWMQRFDYTEEMVADFRKWVVEIIVPIAQKLRQKQKKRLGYEHLEYYDLNFHFLSGNPKPKGTAEDTIAQANQMYKELSPETGELFRYLQEYDLLDLVSRQGKEDGGFCWAFSDYKHPFIFANFNGTLDDVRVLTHEAGHAFQYFESRHYDIIEHRNPTSETAEIHAMSMELLTYPWMEGFFREDTEKYFYSHLNSTLLFIPYGCAIDHFQHIIYQNPDFTPNQRAEAWKEMEALYLPDRKMDMAPYLNSGRVWQSIMHIYQRPFYCIDYVLAQICAFQFWQKSKNNEKEAWADYLRLCKAGGTKPFLELVELANLKPPFDKETLRNVTKEIEKHLEKIDDSTF